MNLPPEYERGPFDKEPFPIMDDTDDEILKEVLSEELEPEAD